MNGSHLLRFSPAAPGTGEEARAGQPWIVKSFILKSLASRIDIWFWRMICSNSLRSRNLGIFVVYCIFELRVQILGYIYKTLQTHSVVSSLSRSQSFCYSPSIYYLEVNIKWRVSDRLFRCCEKIELTRKAGLKVLVSPCLPVWIWFETLPMRQNLQKPRSWLNLWN